jgi:hypothetical protein
LKPSVGRIVHYVSYGTPGGEYPSVCRPAMITAVGDNVEGYCDMASGETCNLAVFNPKGQFFNVCNYDEGKAPGTWHWPERVEE